MPFIYLILLIIALAMFIHAWFVLKVFAVSIISYFITATVIKKWVLYDMTSKVKAFRYIKIDTLSQKEPWQVQVNLIKKDIRSKPFIISVLIIGYISISVCLGVALKEPPQTMERLSYYFSTAVCVVVALLWFISGIDETRKELTNSVVRKFKSGVVGLEYALDLKTISKQISDIYKNQLNTEAPPDKAEEFFNQLSNKNSENISENILLNISLLKNSLDKLNKQITARESLLKKYRQTSKKVNQRAFGSLISEMDDLYTALNSYQIMDLLRNEDWNTHGQVLESISADLDRIQYLTSQCDTKAPNDHRHLQVLSKDDALEVLGVGPDDSLQEIKLRYRSLVKQLHPDTQNHHPEDERYKRELRFRKIQEAWETLKSENNI